MDKKLEMQIARTEQQCGIVIPKVYRDFLHEDHEMIFNDGILYDAEAIAERFRTLEFDRYAPDYVPIGNDNGDYELVMKSGSRTVRFGILEQGAFGSANPAHLQNFRAWYQQGHTFSFESSSGIDWSQNVKVILKKCPEQKANTMLIIRNALRLETPVSELLAAAAHPPVMLTDTLSAAIAKRIIEESELGDWLEIRF